MEEELIIVQHEEKKDDVSTPSLRLIHWVLLVLIIGVECALCHWAYRRLVPIVSVENICCEGYIFFNHSTVFHVYTIVYFCLLPKY